MSYQQEIVGGYFLLTRPVYTSSTPVFFGYGFGDRRWQLKWRKTHTCTRRRLWYGLSLIGCSVLKLHILHYCQFIIVYIEYIKWIRWHDDYNDDNFKS